MDNEPNEDDIENSQNNAEHATSSAGKQANKPNRKRNTASFIAPSSVNKVLEYFQNKRGRYNFDATELILLGYAKTIKTFSLEKQAKTKLQIDEIIMRQEIEHQREQQQRSAYQFLEHKIHGNFLTNVQLLGHFVKLRYFLLQPPKTRHNILCRQTLTITPTYNFCH